jgi:hypothetical protein
MFVRSVLVDRVCLPATRVGSNIQGVLESQLSRKLEGRCSRHGYIAIKSIAVEEVGQGVVQAQALDGSVVFTVTFRADVCSPIVGGLIEATVVNKNRFGFLAEAVTDKDGHSILEIVVAKPAQDVERGDPVTIEVLGCKYELNDTRIAVVGRLLTPKEAATASKRAAAAASKSAEVLSVVDEEEAVEDVDEAGSGLDEAASDDDDGGDEASESSVDESDADDNSDSEVDEFDDEDVQEGRDEVSDDGGD